MTKDAYYFTHDSNAKDDPKCMLLIDQLGLMGYGIFWILVETLRDQKDYKCRIDLVPVLAKRYGSSAELFMTVISKYGLFVIEDDTFFYSKSLNHRMMLWDEAKQSKRIRALKGAEARWAKALPPPSESNAQAMLKHYTSNADAMQVDAMKREEKKGEEMKLKETKREREEIDASLAPIVSEIMSYFDFNEIADFDKLRTVTQAVNLFAHHGIIDRFRAQFDAYKTYKSEKNEYRHSFPKFIGTIEQHFIDGGWNAENWTQKLSDLRASTAKYDYDSTSQAVAARLAKTLQQ